MAEALDGCSSTCNPKKNCRYSSGRGACSCRAAGVWCTDYCPCGKERQCSNKLISEEPTTTANLESDEVREVTEEMAALTTSEAPSSTHDGCSCKPTSTCARKNGEAACPCRVAGKSCASHCSCGKKKQCSNKPISEEPTTATNSESDEESAVTEPATESTYLAETSTIASATTRGGCSFDDLVHGEKNYICETGYLLNLKEEPPVEEEPTYASDETEERAKANQRVARLIGHLNGIFSELEIQGKIVKEFRIGKTFAPKSQRKGVVFNNMDPFTFVKDGIKSRWSTFYKGIGYDGLIVLTVVTKNLLLPKERRQKYKDQEDYALMLERRLIEYYRDEISDPRIANPTLQEGAKSKRVYAGYPVYVAVKF